jgi:endogenous inhibitor of DNA gyrase (YacG/DUF329 family)
MKTHKHEFLPYDEDCSSCGGPVYRGEKFWTHDGDDMLTFCSEVCAAEDLRALERAVDTEIRIASQR